MPTICQSIRKGRLCSQYSKSKVSKEAMVTLIFTKTNFYKEIPLRKLLHQRIFSKFETRKFLQVENPNDGCEDNDTLNS
jgi:hypothetical protein